MVDPRDECLPGDRVRGDGWVQLERCGIAAIDQEFVAGGRAGRVEASRNDGEVDRDFAAEVRMIAGRGHDEPAIGQSGNMTESESPVLAEDREGRTQRNAVGADEAGLDLAVGEIAEDRDEPAVGQRSHVRSTAGLGYRDLGTKAGAVEEPGLRLT